MPPRLRPRLKKYKAGDLLGRWTLVEFIAGGGNADAWRAKAGRRTAALKLLCHTAPEGYERFQREIEICTTTDTDAIAILPILDSHLPTNSKRDRPVSLWREQRPR